MGAVAQGVSQCPTPGGYFFAASPAGMSRLGPVPLICTTVPSSLMRMKCGTPAGSV